MEIPEEIKKKIEALKVKLDKFVHYITKEKEIIAVSVLPPTKLPQEEEQKLSKQELEKIKNRINVLLVLNLDDKKDPLPQREALLKKAIAKANEIDPNLYIITMELYEIREDCFDGKYETLSMIATSAPLYDPKDILAAIRISEVHKSMVLKKFEKYIVSYVAAGSLFRGDSVSRDIDVYVVVDDTDVKKMTRFELRDKLLAIMRKMGDEASVITSVKKAFHIQTYILTDFWEAVKDAHPVIYTFLRDGVPLFDRGVFMPWKLLLKMGRIRPSREAIDMMMNVGEKLIERTKGKLVSVVSEDLYYAIINSAQAALMMYGIAPPTPKETIKLLDEIFVQKEKILEKKYVDMLQKIYDYYKGIEHGKIKEVAGKDIDELLENANDYLNRLNKLFNQIQKRRDKETLEEVYENCMVLLEDALKQENVKIASKESIPNLFKKYFAAGKIFHKSHIDALNELTKAKKEFGTQKLSPEELEKIKRNARLFLKDLFEFVQRKRSYELERAKIRFKYGEKFGEVLLLEDNAFVIEDIAAEEKKIMKADIRSNGSLGKLQESSMEELENAIKGIKVAPKVFIKEPIFESLRKVFGQDIEIMLAY